MAARVARCAAGNPTPGGRARRVVIVMHGFSGGGIERSMLELAHGLIARGFAIDIVVGRAEGDLLAEVPRQARVVEAKPTPLRRVRIHSLAADPAAFGLIMRRRMRPLWPLGRLHQLPGLVEHFKCARPDAVLAAEAAYNLMVVWARRVAGLKCRVVVSEHARVSDHARFQGPWSHRHVVPLLRRAYRRADAIVAVSDGVADDLAAYAELARNRITTVYNPVVGPDLPAKAKEPLHHPWFAQGEPPVILAAGRLDPQKDFATLIRAFARVRARRPARLVMLGAGGSGDPGYVADLMALPTRLGVGDDVEMPGFARNPFVYMSRVAVFVLSSIYEGLGNVLIEAMACGTPVVSTDCPSGPAEILDHGRFGPLVPVGDDAALARAIEDVLDHPQTAERLQARAELFTVQRAVDNYLKLMFPAGEESAGRAAA